MLVIRRKPRPSYPFIGAHNLFARCRFRRKIRASINQRRARSDLLLGQRQKRRGWAKLRAKG